MKRFASNRNRFASLLLAAALCLAAAGCGSTPVGSSAPASPDSAPALPSASTPAAGASGAGEAPAQVLRTAKAYDSPSMDPATWLVDDPFVANCFESLLKYDDALNPAANLAETWEVSDDHLTYTFHLRKGVQFHRGFGELKASDVVFTVTRLGDPEVNASWCGPAMKVDNIASLTAVDDYTVQFTLKKIDTNFLDKLCEFYAYIVSEKAVREMGNLEFSKLPVGTGPFQFDKVVTNERYEIVRFDDYWGDKAKLDRVITNIITEAATSFNALEAGEVDYMAINDTDKALEYQKNPDYVVELTPSRSILYVYMNFNIEPFNDLRVRQAVSYAINYDEMITDFSKGLDSPVTTIISPSCKYVVPDLIHPEYDPEKAKALLADAGFPDGFETTFSCPNDSLSVPPATIIQTYLTAIGIKCQLNTLELAVYFEQSREGKFPLSLLYGDSETVPNGYFENMVTSKRFHDDEFDRYVEQAGNAADDAAKAEWLAKAQKRWAEVLPAVPVSNSSSITLYRANVKDVRDTPNLGHKDLRYAYIAG